MNDQLLIAYSRQPSRVEQYSPPSQERNRVALAIPFARPLRRDSVRVNRIDIPIPTQVTPLQGAGALPEFAKLALSAISFVNNQRYNLWA
jgi:hypothetical protein